MAIVVCKKCNGIARLLSIKISDSKKIVKLTCPRCKTYWTATVTLDWSYGYSVKREEEKKLKFQKQNEETAFGILLKQAIKDSEKK